jgi:hypothetical protein
MLKILLKTISVASGNLTQPKRRPVFKTYVNRLEEAEEFA